MSVLQQTCAPFGRGVSVFADWMFALGTSPALFCAIAFYPRYRTGSAFHYDLLYRMLFVLSDYPLWMRLPWLSFKRRTAPANTACKDGIVVVPLANILQRSRVMKLC
ncbi:hypothetical protein TSMEX_010446 [Taenia solium]|eukprot:TsM_000457500 transcript=TsM_000457500 gene=TsM_000457500